MGRLLRSAHYFVFLALFVFPAASRAQSGTSVISGIVTDATKAPIPSATVRVINEDTGVAVETLTNSEGLYRVATLVPGRYQVEVTLDGFEPFVQHAILQVGQTLGIDVALAIKGRSETVSVRADVPLVETQTSTINQAVTREMLQALPLPNRAASSLASLAPGVVMVDLGTGTAENYPVFSVAGGRSRNQIFTLDGGNATNAVGLTRPQQLTSLPVDAMQEFRVIANNYSAEFGHSTGGVVAMSTRSGTNTYRGTVFDSLRDDALDARNVFAQSKPPINLKQLGGTFGGPLSRDRAFVFGSWERTRQVVGSAVVSTVPTLLNRQGNFSDLRTSSGQLIPVYDPITGAPFDGNIIPADRIDPVAQKALEYYPRPNRAGTVTNASNFVGNSEASLSRDIVVAKTDYAVTGDDRLTVRYYLNESGTSTTGSYGNPVADPLGDTADVRVQSLLAAHTHSFTSNVANELRITYLRRKFVDRRPGLNQDLAGAIGLRGVTPSAFPAFTIPGYAPLSNPNLARFQTPITDTQILESLSWFKGKHALKIGTEVRLGGNSEIRDRGSSGSMSFSPLFTSNGGAPNTGNALATFLLGEINSASVQSSDRITTRAQYLAYYAQDDWRVTNRLTLNYGLRYDLELPRREVAKRMNSFDPTRINPVSGTPGVVTFAGANGTSERAFKTDINNFGPRFGFAYQLTSSGHTVLRGGSGVFYGQTVDATVGDAASLGFSTQASFVVSQAASQSAFRLRDGFPQYSRTELNDGFGAVPVGSHPNTAVSFFNPEQVAPVSYQTNINLQHQLASGLVLEVAYINNESRHLGGPNLTLNQVRPERVSSGDTQVARPFPQFSDVVWINPSIGTSSYHGIFLRAQRRFSDRFSVLGHYTWSRYFDDIGASAAGDDYGPGVGSYADAYNRKADWARSGDDVPHHVVVTALYEIPSLSGRPMLKAIAGGWHVGVLHTIQSGPLFTVTTAANTTNAFPAGPLRPDLVGNPELPASQRMLTHWFNTAAFENPVPLTFGNSPRSVLRGPKLVTTDLTLEKTVLIRGSKQLDIRAELYNLLNNVNLNPPGSVLGAADFGVISSARPARTVQLGVRLSF
jgi:hypothetical protein